MSSLIDISWPIANTMTTYKDRKDVHIISSSVNGYMRESLLQCHVHTGTHVDAPAHCIEGGKTVDQLSLDLLYGRAYVIDCTQVEECITNKELQSYTDILTRYSRILFKTKNSFLPSDAPFNYSFVYVQDSAARYLKECGVQTVGIDYLGIERNQQGHPTHKLLLQEGAIIEGLRLAPVQEGAYELVCVPLLMQGADGAPARAYLKQL